MKREFTTLGLIVVAMVGTFAGAWWARSLLVPPAKQPEPERPGVVEVGTLRATRLELIDTQGRTRLFATTNGDEVQLTMQGTETGSPIVYLTANNDAATAKVSCLSEAKAISVSRGH